MRASLSREIRNIQSARRDRDARKARIQRHEERLAMLRLLLTEYEALEDADQVRDLKKKIRTLEQQIRYIGAP